MRRGTDRHADGSDHYTFRMAVSDAGASGMMSPRPTHTPALHVRIAMVSNTIHHLPISKRRQVLRFRTLFLCVSINFFRAFLSRLLIDALRFCNTAGVLADVDRQLNDAMVLGRLVVEALERSRGGVTVAQTETDVGRRNTRHVALPRADRRLQPPATRL